MKKYRTDRTIYVDFATGEVINYELEKMKGGRYIEVEKSISYKEIGNTVWKSIVKVVRKNCTEQKLF